MHRYCETFRFSGGKRFSTNLKPPFLLQRIFPLDWCSTVFTTGGGTLVEKCDYCRTWSAPLVTCSSPASRARSVSPSPSPSFSGNPARWRPCLRRLAFTTTPAVVGWVGEEDYQPPLWSTTSTITSPHPPTKWAYSFDIAYAGKEQLTLLHNIFQRHIGFPQKSDEITS